MTEAAGARTRILCSGMGALDRAFVLPALPASPGKYIASAYRERGGGMAANASVAIAALGGHACWCGRLGDDPSGETVRAMLLRAGVDLAGATIAKGAQTAVAGIHMDPSGERMLAVFPGAGLPDDAPIPDALVDGAGAVLGDPRWAGGSARLFQAAAARGIPRVFDADTAPIEILQRLVPLADHVVFSERGLRDFTGIADAAEALRSLVGRVPATLGVTLGEKGSLWWLDGALRAVPAPVVDAVDTTGCGDVFHGGYALALAEGADVMTAIRFATAAAALKAANGDGWDGMPKRAAVEALLARGW
jgi:sulfofructose kinase